MHMLLMLGIFALIFVATLLIMCLYRSKINTKIWNTCFILLDIVFFFCWNWAGYQVGWLDSGWLTFGNISPFMFTLMPLTVFMNDKVKEYAFSAFAGLNVGMFFAMLVSPEHAYLFNFDTEASFLYTAEAACHMLCSLYGVYLVLSGQVKADFRHWVKSIVFMYSVITYGVLLNAVFRTNNFGMNPYGNYSIYMFDFFGSFAGTLLAYYLCVAVVLTVGMQGASFLEKLTARHVRQAPDRLQNQTEPQKGGSL